MFGQLGAESPLNESPLELLEQPVLARQVLRLAVVRQSWSSSLGVIVESVVM
jgi:hypothetical protein